MNVLVASLVPFFVADSNLKQLPGLVLWESFIALFAMFEVFRFVLCPAFASNIFVQYQIDLSNLI